MREKGKLVVLDFDDTLFFTHGSIKKATKELFNRTDLSKAKVRKLPKKTKSQIYELAYSKYKHYSKPNLMLLKRLEKYEKGFKIVVLTARGKSLHTHTLALIKKHKIKIHGFYSRPNVQGEDEVWKLAQLRKYCKDYSETHIYEDKKDNIAYIKKHMKGYNIKFYLVTKKSIRQS